MPLIDLYVKSSEVGEYIDERMDKLREVMKELVSTLVNSPKNDIIVTLHRCTVKNADPDGAELVVIAATNPGEVENVADSLVNTISMVLMEQLKLRDLAWSVEVWPIFLNGPWQLLRRGFIVDEVTHHK